MKTKYSFTMLAAAIALAVSSMTLQATEIDDKIETTAKSSYVFKTYLNDDVKVESDEGIVTLSGEVDDPAYKVLAEDTISSLPGVKSIENKLTVNEDSPARNSDAWLVTKVKTALLFHRNVSAMTKVTASKGVVTLKGVADSQAEKDLTGEYAMDIEGVSKINNEMTLAAMPKEKVQQETSSIDDASITAQVKMVLLTHRSTSALHTSVDTTDGVVTLSGEAKNDAEISLASKVAGDVKGVAKVNNIMTVAAKS